MSSSSVNRQQPVGGGRGGQASSSSSSSSPFPRSGGSRGQEDSPAQLGARVPLAPVDSNRGRGGEPPNKKTRCDPKHLATKGKAKAVCRTEGNAETALYSGLLDPTIGALWIYRCLLLFMRTYFFSASVENPAVRLQKDVKQVFAKKLEEYEVSILNEEESDRMRYIWEYVNLPANHPVLIAVHTNIADSINSYAFDIRAILKEWFTLLHPQGLFISTTKKDKHGVVQNYEEPGEIEVIPMMLGMDGTVTPEWLNAFAGLHTMLKIMIRCVTNPEDFAALDLAFTCLPEHPSRDPEGQRWIVKRMALNDMKLLARGRYPYPVVFPIAEMLRYVCSHYPAYTDTYMSKEAVPFLAFILTQLCALLDNPYMSATPYRGMKDKHFQPYHHARNLAITLKDEVSSPDLVAVVKKSMEEIRPTKRVRRYVCTLRDEPDDDETMDREELGGERELDVYAISIGAESYEV